MVVPDSDPLQSLFNSVHLAFSPLGSNVHNLAKNLDCCFNGVLKNVGSNFDVRRGVDLNLNLSKKQLQFEVALPFLADGKDSSFIGDSSERVEVGEMVFGEIKPKKSNGEEGKDFPFEHLMGFLSDQLSHFPKCKDELKVLTGVSEGRQARGGGFFANLRFSRVRGEECSGGSSDNVDQNELLRAHCFKFVTLKELVEHSPPIGGFTKEDHPDEKELLSVQHFFRYTEAEEKRLFHELDRDGDGKVTLEDLEIAMANRNLPRRYAKEFMKHTRSRMFTNSFGWNEFLSVMEQKETTSLRAYTSLRLSKLGMPQKDEILASLKNAGLSATEDNATAVMHYLNTNYEESKSYSHFRSFVMLLPSNSVPGNPRGNSSTRADASDPPRVEIQRDSVFKTALAGGISCSFSTLLMHPIDTVKTQVQASSALSFIEIMSKLPQLGLRGLYLGSIPAIVGQFLSHGLRTGICEVTKIALINVAPSLPELQVESAGSFLGTFLGTTMRIPCEVLKQRLQAGQFNHVGEALVGTWQQDGLGGFFRGTGMTLCRELPFYVAGSGLYAESKKAVQKLLGRELGPWETVVVGAVSGGLTAVMTTPFDVIKTRMMTALQGELTTISVVALSILRNEGPLGLFRGAVPRFFWVAPLGAINFAGYELMRKAMG
ncbi:calcium-binding mitochondrial carrier protein SCaMC-1-like [Salvia hispanica]|uniref:calcium-binding mitochondrial carrier protein SCaMC-1-like n=1 Tax=Salvia hispanica TaxID=49212 RepID=UPI00200915CB|nr:calcium-binding mitochondrial carrier protein SCaMC-1-like [Salvia hispanica]